ncbi:MAG: gephyrin-like molybdotransferase Glp [Rhodanobacter sp.]
MNAVAPPSAFPTRIGFEQALAIVAQQAARHLLPTEQAKLADALSQVLACDVLAHGNVPSFARSAMDGFALRGAELPRAGERTFELVGEVLAGAASVPMVGSGQCARVATGAPMPAGADTVVIQENVQVNDGRVRVGASERPGANVHVVGETWRAGDVALSAGVRLGPRELAVPASLGLATVSVRRAPRIALIATGSELIPAGQPLGFGQIHESNTVMLAAMARQSTYEVVSQSHVRDDPDAIRTALLDASRDADIVVTSGGMSAGSADYLPDVLAVAGSIHFHKVRLRPCIPLLFGELNGHLYFGLPGTPAGSAVGFQVFVQHAVRIMSGLMPFTTAGYARLGAPLSRHRAQEELVRCSLRVDATGIQWATLYGKRRPAAPPGIVEQDALALLPEGIREFTAGEVVALWPLEL